MIWERFNLNSAMMGVLTTLLLIFGQPAGAETATTTTAAPAASDIQATAKYVGEKKCISCHENENNSFTHTLHAKIFRENPKNETEKLVCEACHGPGSLHAKKTKDHSLLIGFTKSWGTPVSVMNGQCLACHSGGQRISWGNSIHDKNKLSCSDCHNPMARFSATGLLKKQSISETCQTCHQQQRAEFKKRSHMPVPEGKMSCEDCHNPHGTTGQRLLKADSVNELCYTCHMEKRGPFIWEHAPVRENCLNCHLPHGSNNDKLLVQTRPFLCVNCHSNSTNMGHTVWDSQTLPGSSLTSTTNAVPAGQTGTMPATSKRMSGRSCQNCHSQIHGSNHPAGARFQR
jgi:DmsE family decaheme c-type cytochrome